MLFTIHSDTNAWVKNCADMWGIQYRYKGLQCICKYNIFTTSLYTV